MTTHPNATPAHGHDWPRDSAGRLMTPRVPTAKPSSTLGEIHADIEKRIDDFEAIEYVYVVEADGRLSGVLSLHDLYRGPAHTTAAAACKMEDIVSVKPWTDQERVAYAALKHNLRAIPVTDHDHRFLGAIPCNVILHILYRETHEDLMRRAGIHSGHSAFDSVLTMSIWQSLKHRVPWLLIGLLGGVLAANVIGAFEHTLEQNIILAAFIPLIVYMGDAVGTQMEAFIIRDIAMDHHLPFLRYLWRQLLVVMVLAALFGLLLLGASAVFYDTPHISLVLSISLAAAICSSVFTGLLIPYGFHKLKMDPANASGPVATILQDLLSIIIYFTVATLLL